jgi:hypothetical protein
MSEGRGSASYYLPLGRLVEMFGELLGELAKNNHRLFLQVKT